MSESNLPPLSKEPIHHVDLTPTPDLAVRILKVYRENCDSKWEAHGVDDNTKAIYDMMNRDQDHRAMLLDEAIRVLTMDNIGTFPSSKYNFGAATGDE